jgi:hypothetical protein
MEPLEQYLLLEAVRFHAAWLIPLLVSAAAALHAVRTGRRVGAIGLFRWALVAVSLGYAGAYSNWRLLASQVGVGGDVPFDVSC